MAAGLLLANVGWAQIVPFEYDKSARSQRNSSERRIEQVHLEMPNSAGTAEAARLAILRSVSGKAGRMFFFEGEGLGYIDVRFDIKRNPMWFRVEYTDAFVQVQYLDGLWDVACERVVQGACYKNHRHYYKFGRTLRKNINRQLQRLAKGAP
jgi:hypothetical protein